MQYIPPTIGYARMIFNIIIAFGALLFIWGLLGLVLPHVKAAAPGPMGFGHGPKPPGAPSPPPPLIIKEVKEEYKVDMDAMNVINEIISSLQKKDDPNKIENRIKNLEHLIRDEEKRVGKVASILHQLQDYEAKLNEAILPLHQTWGKAGRRAKELQSEIMTIRHRIDAYRKDHFLPMIADLGNIEKSIRENSRQIEQLIASMRSHLQRALSTKGDAQAAVIVEDYPRALRDALSIKQILEAEVSRLNTAYTEAQRVMHGVKGFQDALARLQSQVQQLRHEVEIEGGKTK
jgi:chromosome segregation ATPase